MGKKASAMTNVKKSGYPKVLAIAASLAVASVIAATGTGGTPAAPSGSGAAASIQTQLAESKNADPGFKAAPAKAPAKYELGFIVNKDHS